MKHQQPFKSSLAMLLLMFSSLVFSYEIRTHEALTKEALKKSIYSSDVITTLGMKIGQQLPNPSVMDGLIDGVSTGFFSGLFLSGCKGETDGCSFLGRNKEGNYADIILNGSSYEDLAFGRPLNHFYDPINDRGLTLTALGTYDVKLKLLGNKNPDWAMKNGTSFSYNACTEFLFTDDKSCLITEQPQIYSYPDVYDYFYKALTSIEQKDRDINFGRMFQSLGQVSHLLQDMAAIEHVRNDSHLVIELSPFGIPLTPLKDAVEFMIRQYSRYEIYTETLAKKNNLPFSNGYFSADVPVNLSKARDYWVTGTGGLTAQYGRGLSEFTNTNFFSQDTNLQMYNNQPVITYYELPKPYVDDLPEIPVGIRALYAEKNELLPTELERICPLETFNSDCFIQFVRTQVHDNLLGQVLINNRATSFSLFDMDLQYRDFRSAACSNPDVCKLNRLFALNRFNFDEMHKFLIPRAVAYSAGLLKHFFRGKLEISRPDTGFYFDVDSIVNQNYTKVSLHVQNKTAEIIKEDILPIYQNMQGNFEVVIRYTLPTNPNKEEVSISKRLENIPLEAKTPVKVPLPTLLTFDLSTPVPVDAENVNLYLVYRGTLGEETDVVVVGRQPVEPLIIETVAGTGVGGFSGDGGFAKNAQLYFPHSIALDNEGNLYISDYENDRIRKVFTNGTIITIAGSGQRGYSTGGGSALQASLNGPRGIAIGPEGAVYFIDNYNATLRKVLNNTITNVTGSYGGYVKTVAGNPLYVRDGRLIFNESTLYMTQSYMSTIYKIDGNLASIIAGNVGYNPWNPAPYPNDGVSALQATLGIPYGITWHNGALHFSDVLYKQVFKLDACSTGGTDCLLYRVAGSGNSGYIEDGVAAREALLNNPSGIVSSPSGSLYIAVENDHHVRSVDANGKIATIAGNGMAGSSGDGGLPVKASLNSPSGLAVAPNGDLYIAEFKGHRVRRIKGLK